LFNSGVRPAINVGISVSRVGGNAQIKAMKQVAGTLRLELAQFREMAAFAQFASDLDAATRQQLSRGERLVEVLKQGQFVPWPVEEQVVSIFAGTHGYLDPLPPESIGRYQQELVSWLKAERASILGDIVSKGKIDDTLESQLEDALKAFGEIFEPKQQHN
jgi:F-type H+-transporting ATPase subunit alpha